MADRLSIFGSGGHAKVVLEAALARSPGREITLLDDDPSNHGRQLLGVSVSGGREALGQFGRVPVALGVGNNAARWALIEWLRGMLAAGSVTPLTNTARAAGSGDALW